LQHKRRSVRFNTKKTPQGLLLSQCAQKGANLRYSAEAQGEAARATLTPLLCGRKIIAFKSLLFEVLLRLVSLFSRLCSSGCSCPAPGGISELFVLERSARWGAFVPWL
jgi:hypothetical protein